MAGCQLVGGHVGNRGFGIGDGGVDSSDDGVVIDGRIDLAHDCSNWFYLLVVVVDFAFVADLIL